MAYNSRKGSVKNILDRLFSAAFGGIAVGGAASFGVIGHRWCVRHASSR